MFLYAAALTVSPAVRIRSWEANLRWGHWVAVGFWVIGFGLAHFETIRRLPNRDPYILPIASLLSGWGLLIIWRLFPSFGLRQTAWLLIALLILILGLRLPSRLGFLRQYKYIWLTFGLLLTGLTLILGTNPSGASEPRLWLGCCGIFLQPSEPLKLLLVIYLAAYLSDRLMLPEKDTPKTARQPFFPTIAPTILITGLALLLLLFQHDLGTASIFLFLFTVILYLVTGRKRVILISSLGLISALFVGYILFDVVRIRVDAWINPWVDPSNRSYQIVQSLIAIANGGLLGRGPGLGNPSLVPVPHSDFIFSALTEEMGLSGAIGLFILLALLTSRGILISIQASDYFRRYLAMGLTVFLIAQSILIIGGNIRLLPLTGVTLPFVSYGGSSLVTSFLSLLLLLLISQETKKRAPLSDLRPYMNIVKLLSLSIIAAVLVTSWFVVIRGPGLLLRTDNARRSIADRFVRRGSIFDRNGSLISTTTGNPGNYVRKIVQPTLSNIVGYTHPAFGQAGLESSLDAYLRGIQGNPSRRVLLDSLLFGQPPPGIDVRLSLNLELQKKANQLIQNHPGSIVLLDADSGEILVMVSNPTFDANQLDDHWSSFVEDPNSPLLNRTTQGLYPPGTELGVFLLASAIENLKSLPEPENLDISVGSKKYDCVHPPTHSSLESALQNGCPGAIVEIGQALDPELIENMMDSLGLNETPDIPIARAVPTFPEKNNDPVLGALGLSSDVSKLENIRRLTPFQLALAATSLSNEGIVSSPKLVLAINSPISGWIPIEKNQEEHRVFSEFAASAAANLLTIEGTDFWGVQSYILSESNQEGSWFLGGTLPKIDESYVVVVMLEENDPDLAQQIGVELLETALLNP